MAAQYFAAPAGTAAGNGTMSNPWNLATALNQPPGLLPGDTLWLCGGIYTGFFTSNLNGSAGWYIFVLQYPGERAIIADNRQFASGATLQVNGSYTVYKDFEITNTHTSRNPAGAASFRPMGLQVQAPETKFINLVIHDAGHGFGFWKEAVNAEIYGCIIYNCGTANLPGVYQTHGHGIYAQNDNGTKTIKHNIIFNQFGFGLHLYPNPGNIKGFNISGNTLFNNGVLTGDTVRYNNILANVYTPYAAERVSVVQNCTYDSRSFYQYNSLFQADVFLGATDVNSKKLTVSDNYFMGNGRAGLAIFRWDSVTASGNTTFYRSNGSVGFLLAPGGTNTAHNWNNNMYYGASNPLQFSYQGGTLTHFNNWKTATGFDAGSSFQDTTPSGTKIFIQPNVYEPGRANIIVYNHDSLPGVNIDLSATGLTNGQSFRIHDAQNFFGSPLVSGVYSSASPIVHVSVTGFTTAAPAGMAALPQTAPKFIALVVLPAGTVTGVNTTRLPVFGVSVY
ncbi:MAG: right-handed parallel beta-helix repeat-containing protein, partial [Dinghuibacter sp.]|nr:right-handed parallel beta-helix repeat-containing protein [Dinghuibacter sp.]